MKLGRLCLQVGPLAKELASLIIAASASLRENHDMLHEKFQFMGKITSDSSLSQLHPSLFMGSTQRARLHLYGDSNMLSRRIPTRGG